MKRIIFMLLVICSSVMTINAQSYRSRSNPEKVIAAFSNLAATDSKVISIKKEKNPVTNLLEVYEKITHFKCDESKIKDVEKAFMADESLCYQLIHIDEGSDDVFTLEVLSTNPRNNTNHQLRTKKGQNLWLMCTKNTNNPKLRNAYAVVWEKNGNTVTGDIYDVASLRPDVFESEVMNSKNTFSIDGRVGYDLTDSLYVFYTADTYGELCRLIDMADTYSEMKKVVPRDKVTDMPVVNKHFQYVEKVDKRKIGAIRTVMPGGVLCHLQTFIDIVPGESYRITTHNGYYDPDRDYERRVGRYSGKSLIREDSSEDDFGGDTVAVDNVVCWEGVEHDEVEGVNGEWRAPRDDFSSASSDFKEKLSKDPQLKEKFEEFVAKGDKIEKEIRNIMSIPDPKDSKKAQELVDGTMDLYTKRNKFFNEFEKFLVKQKAPKIILLECNKYLMDDFIKMQSQINQTTDYFYRKQLEKFKKFIEKNCEKYTKKVNKLFEEAKKEQGMH